MVGLELAILVADSLFWNGWNLDRYGIVENMARFFHFRPDL